MASLPVAHATVEEYLKLDRASQIPHEYIFGEIVPAPAATLSHGVIQANIVRAVGNLLSTKRSCVVAGSGLRMLLQRNSLYGYPDVTVVCGKPEYSDEQNDTLLNPKLVAEVLSPSTRNYDLGDKTRAYLKIPSLTDVLLVEQDRIGVEYWSRPSGGKWEWAVFSDAGDIIRIASLECDLPLAEIYSKVEIPDDAFRG